MIYLYQVLKLLIITVIGSARRTTSFGLRRTLAPVALGVLHTRY